MRKSRFTDGQIIGFSSFVCSFRVGQTLHYIEGTSGGQVSTSPPSFRSHRALPSTRSIRGVEIRGKRRLINDRHANLQATQVNVTTPSKV